MTEGQRVFIRGVKGRGKEVIKALRDLGGKDCLSDGNHPERIFFISDDGDIYWALIDSEFGKVIMDNYREIKIPEKWEDGDILYSNDLGK